MRSDDIVEETPLLLIVGAVGGDSHQNIGQIVNVDRTTAAAELVLMDSPPQLHYPLRRVCAVHVSTSHGE
jgi:hypothetical protein